VERFSEFYILGRGFDAGLPDGAVAGQPVVVTLAITNRERGYGAYVVETTIDGDLVSRTDTIRLANDKDMGGQALLHSPRPGRTNGWSSCSCGTKTPSRT